MVPGALGAAPSSGVSVSGVRQALTLHDATGHAMVTKFGFTPVTE